MKSREWKTEEEVWPATKEQRGSESTSMVARHIRLQLCGQQRSQKIETVLKKKEKEDCKRFLLN